MHIYIYIYLIYTLMFLMHAHTQLHILIWSHTCDVHFTYQYLLAYQRCHYPFFRNTDWLEAMKINLQLTRPSRVLLRNTILIGTKMLGWWKPWWNNYINSAESFKVHHLMIWFFGYQLLIAGSHIGVVSQTNKKQTQETQTTKGVFQQQKNKTKRKKTSASFNHLWVFHPFSHRS